MRIHVIQVNFDMRRMDLSCLSCFSCDFSTNSIATKKVLIQQDICLCLTVNWRMFSQINKIKVLKISRFILQNEALTLSQISQLNHSCTPWTNYLSMACHHLGLHARQRLFLCLWRVTTQAFMHAKGRFYIYGVPPSRPSYTPWTGFMSMACHHPGLRARQRLILYLWRVTTQIFVHAKGQFNVYGVLPLSSCMS